ncbi:MAG: hypothetical protein ACXABY_01425 [Candidatus Thorarchaeota archaeon]
MKARCNVCRGSVVDGVAEPVKMVCVPCFEDTSRIWGMLQKVIFHYIAAQEDGVYSGMEVRMEELIDEIGILNDNIELRGGSKHGNEKS